MWSFVISIIALILGYFLYGTLVDRLYGPDPSKPTPAVTKADGVDFVPLPTWKVFMIQFLNIAGTGPIFGAIMGAKFGPAAYLWIVLGCIFAGGVHDYMSGMFSVHGDGLSLPNTIGHLMGRTARRIVLVVSVALLLLVGTVFVYSPALILGDIAGDGSKNAIMIWVLIVFAYYILATLLPVDKIIAKIYPIFAFALLFMALGLTVCLFVKWPHLPEVWNGLDNLGPSIGLKGQRIFPCLFITIACGAVSGFHSTQSPIMARCLQNEKLGKPVFYGAMVMEGIVALVWATVSSYFFFDGGAAEVGSSLSAQAPEIVVKVSSAWLGVAGGVLAILGVVCAPITSGDTAFRSARLIIADSMHFDQKHRRNRLVVALPVFAAACLLLWYNIADENGFNVIWRYFGWANQSLAALVLWCSAIYFKTRRNNLSYLIAFVPAFLLTVIVVSYICMEKIGFSLPYGVSIIIGVAVSLLLSADFFLRRHYNQK